MGELSLLFLVLLEFDVAGEGERSSPRQRSDSDEECENEEPAEEESEDVETEFPVESFHTVSMGGRDV